MTDTPPPIGHNQPPEPTPFELTEKEINDLFDEAKGWLDGEPIANEGQAAEIAELRRRIQIAAKAGEERRVAEAKPFDDAKKKVQDAYNPLIHKDKGKAKMALDALNRALAPYLEELDRQQRAAAAQAAKEAREAEDRAREASRLAAESANLAQREEAERLQEEAKALAKTNRAAEQAKPRVHATGGGRAIGMKTVRIPELADPAAAIEHYRKAQPAALKKWMIEQAKKDVRAGAHHIPGFTMREEKVPV